MSKVLRYLYAAARLSTDDEGTAQNTLWVTDRRGRKLSNFHAELLAERIGDFVVYCTPDAKVSSTSMPQPADERSHLLLVHCELHASGVDARIIRTSLPLPSGGHMLSISTNASRGMMTCSTELPHSLCLGATSDGVIGIIWHTVSDITAGLR